MRIRELTDGQKDFLTDLKNSFKEKFNLELDRCVALCGGYLDASRDPKDVDIFIDLGMDPEETTKRLSEIALVVQDAGVFVSGTTIPGEPKYSDAFALITGSHELFGDLEIQFIIKDCPIDDLFEDHFPLSIQQVGYMPNINVKGAWMYHASVIFQILHHENSLDSFIDVFTEKRWEKAEKKYKKYYPHTKFRYVQKYPSR